MCPKSPSSVDAPVFEDNFRIIGATCNDSKEVIWICKYFEPFNVVPVYSSKVRKKQWIECTKYFGKKIKCYFSKKSRRGVPQGKVYGVAINDN